MIKNLKEIKNESIDLDDMLTNLLSQTDSLVNLFKVYSDKNERNALIAKEKKLDKKEGKDLHFITTVLKAEFSRDKVRGFLDLIPYIEKFIVPNIEYMTKELENKIDNNIEYFSVVGGTYKDLHLLYCIETFGKIVRYVNDMCRFYNYTLFNNLKDKDGNYEIDDSDKHNISNRLLIDIKLNIPNICFLLKMLRESDKSYFESLSITDDVNTNISEEELKSMISSRLINKKLPMLGLEAGFNKNPIYQIRKFGLTIKTMLRQYREHNLSVLIETKELILKEGEITIGDTTRLEKINEKIRKYEKKIK